MELLEKIRFPWKTREDGETTYDELSQIRKDTGTSVVPRICPRFPKVYRWVCYQKVKYQKYYKIRSNRLKPEQVRLLNDLGFAYSLSLVLGCVPKERMYRFVLNLGKFKHGPLETRTRDRTSQGTHATGGCVLARAFSRTLANKNTTSL